MDALNLHRLGGRTVDNGNTLHSPTMISRSQCPSEALGQQNAPTNQQHPRHWVAGAQLKADIRSPESDVQQFFTSGGTFRLLAARPVLFVLSKQRPGESMKNVVPLAALVAVVAGQSTFEVADFNTTEALLNNGVNVSELPVLASLVDRASTSGCSAAVSHNE
jgi:hypothetical protein